MYKLVCLHQFQQETSSYSNTESPNYAVSELCQWSEIFSHRHNAFFLISSLLTHELLHIMHTKSPFLHTSIFSFLTFTLENKCFSNPSQ